MEPIEAAIKTPGARRIKAEKKDKPWKYGVEVVKER